MRYLAASKQASGEQLTDQENEMLRETWEDRRRVRKDADPSGKTKAKPKEEKKRENERPDSADPIVEVVHVIDEINEFLDDTSKDRLRYVSGEESLFTETDAESLSELAKINIEKAMSEFADKKEVQNKYKSSVD